jgi:hypothetical protein
VKLPIIPVMKSAVSLGDIRVNGIRSTELASYGLARKGLLVCDFFAHLIGKAFSQFVDSQTFKASATSRPPPECLSRQHPIAQLPSHPIAYP